MSPISFFRTTGIFLLLLALGATPAPAQQPTTVTLSTTATSPVHGPFNVTAQFGAPMTSFTASHLALSNATVTGLRGIPLQNTMSSGVYHNLVLKSDGTVVAWGSNSYGQCSVPAGLSGMAAVAGGDYHSLALKVDGTVVAWGNNGYGKCSVPAGLSGVVAIDGSNGHSLALKSNGTMVAWGDNGAKQCSVPPGLSGVVAIDGGSHHSLALKADGTVVAWGDNSEGQRTVPAGLKIALPGLTHCIFTVTPLAYGPLTVQLPADAVTSFGGQSNAASNLLQRTYAGPQTAIRSWDLYPAE